MCRVIAKVNAGSVIVGKEMPTGSVVMMVGIVLIAKVLIERGTVPTAAGSA